MKLPRRTPNPWLRILGLPALIFLASGIVHATEGPYSVFNQHPDLSLSADGKWKVHDPSRPLPPRAEPKSEAELRESATAPRGAVILFDGGDLSAWNVPQAWSVRDGVLEVSRSLYLTSRETFGSCHLHVEWKAPTGSNATGQDRANSGLFLMKDYEIQILDTYDNESYADGIAASLYGVAPPTHNALRPSGEWQTYDVWFRRPVFGANGEMLTPACVTVQVNGVTVQDNTPFTGPSSNARRKLYQAHADSLPLRIQYHTAAISFRNIWIERLPDDQVMSPAGRVGIERP